MQHNHNTYLTLSRGILVAFIVIATICFLCGIGAKLPQIPWLMLALAFVILLLVGGVVWLLGYSSNETPTPPTEEEEEEEDDKENIIHY